MTSANFSDFLTPTLLVRTGQLVYTIKFTLPYIVRFSTNPLPPLGADVTNGCPLSGSLSRQGKQVRHSFTLSHAFRLNAQNN